MMQLIGSNMKLPGILIVLLSAWFSQPAFSEPAQIILLRHAEKPNDPAALHLSREGQQRAQALIKFFTETNKLTKLGEPHALFACQPTRRGHGQRPYETLTPLAKHLHMSIQTPYLSEDYKKLAKSILHNAKFNGKTVVICWVHEYLPELAAALGVHPQPAKWKDSVFDQVYLITYRNGKADLDEIWQKLLPGDHKYKEP
jgi:hypothetical protein